MGSNHHNFLHPRIDNGHWRGTTSRPSSTPPWRTRTSTTSSSRTSPKRCREAGQVRRLMSAQLVRDALDAAAGAVPKLAGAGRVDASEELGDGSVSAAVAAAGHVVASWDGGGKLTINVLTLGELYERVPPGAEVPDMVLSGHAAGGAGHGGGPRADAPRREPGGELPEGHQRGAQLHRPLRPALRRRNLGERSRRRLRWMNFSYKGCGNILDFVLIFLLEYLTGVSTLKLGFNFKVRI